MITISNETEKLEKVAVIDKLKKAVPTNRIFELASGLIAIAVIALFVISFLPDEIGQKALDLINSNLILTLIGAVVAPWLAKTAKDKVGIDLDAKDFKDLLDAVATASDLSRKEVDAMRKEGEIDSTDYAEARQIAIDKLGDVMGKKKYSNILKKMGDKAIERAIDEYAKSDWQKRYPIEKKQVMELANTAIEIIRKVKNWSELTKSEQEKVSNEGLTVLKDLLKGVGITGWGDTVLKNFVKAGLNTT